MKKHKETKLVCPNCKSEIRYVIPEETTKDKLEQFLEWLEEEDPYPILDHGDMIVALDEFKTEINA